MKHHKPGCAALLLAILLVGVLSVTACGAVHTQRSRASPIPGPTGTVPVDWKAGVADGWLLYSALEPARPELEPSVGNGFVSTAINSSAVYVAGVFNPIAPSALSRSRRSRVPTTVRIEIESADPFASALDIQHGIFYRRSFQEYSLIANRSCMIVYEQRWYAHRVHKELLITEIDVDTSRCYIEDHAADTTSTTIRVGLVDRTGEPSADIVFQQQQQKRNGDIGSYELSYGTTIYPEEPGAISVALAYVRDVPPKALQVQSGDVSTHRFITAFATSLDDSPPPPPLPAMPMEPIKVPDCGASDLVRIECGPNLTETQCKHGGCCYDAKIRYTKDGKALPKCFFGVKIVSQALASYKQGLADADSLLPTHIKAWESLLEAGITIEGNNELRAVVRSSYYAILSAIRDDWPYSVSPGGLSSGGGNATGYPGQEEQGYFGHTFWDADVWVMPALLPFYVNSAQSIINYRYQRIPAAEVVAMLYDFKGAKFAWESALIGMEECIVPNVEDHLSADISIAVRQYFRATGDKDWLKAKGFPLLKSIADFWVSRVVLDSNGEYSINDVQPPNEYIEHANNSVFTNVAAILALEFTYEAAQILKVSVPDKYMDIAKKIKVPFDSKLQMHIEYDGRAVSDKDPLKQADVTLLNYPLQYAMNNTVRRNDLTHEQALISPLGPAMTHGIFVIDYLDIDRKDAAILKNASESFVAGYSLYVHKPFYVWLECPDPGCVVAVNGTAVPPCPNFITGAGGFLQSLVYGYAGLRYNADSLTLLPTLPDNTTSITLSRIAYQSALIDVRYDAKQVQAMLNKDSPKDASDLELRDCAGRTHKLTDKTPVTVPINCIANITKKAQ
eukprot:TRINITY_DN1860_c0_g2_i1.p1 TRINITY_DN1860_c0_g2~~TRINITY_DN1860_c0_g2_i1.p1  ORF type:complete len:847 (-),score=118.70 TRINITY_DN1860_c0_g2_i1:27-2567(-)